MKPVKTTAVIILMASFMVYAAINQDKKIKIIDYRNSKEIAPDENLTQHKEKDIEIYRLRLFENSYLTRIYRMENGKLKTYNSYCGTKEDFNEAVCSWISDTSVSIKLINPAKGISKSFSISGNEGRSSLFEMK